MQPESVMVITDSDETTIYVVKLNKFPVWCPAIGIVDDVDEMHSKYFNMGFTPTTMLLKDVSITKMHEFVTRVMRELKVEGFEFIHCEQFSTAGISQVIYFQNTEKGEAYEVVIRDDCNYLVTEGGSVRMGIETILMNVKK